MSFAQAKQAQDDKDRAVVAEHRVHRRFVRESQQAQADFTKVTVPARTRVSCAAGDEHRVAQLKGWCVVSLCLVGLLVEQRFVQASSLIKRVVKQRSSLARAQFEVEQQKTQVMDATCSFAPSPCLRNRSNPYISPFFVVPVVDKALTSIACFVRHLIAQVLCLGCGLGR